MNYYTVLTVISYPCVLPHSHEQRLQPFCLRVAPGDVLLGFPTVHYCSFPGREKHVGVILQFALGDGELSSSEVVDEIDMYFVLEELLGCCTTCRDRGKSFVLVGFPLVLSSHGSGLIGTQMTPVVKGKRIELDANKLELFGLIFILKQKTGNGFTSIHRDCQNLSLFSLSTMNEVLSVMNLPD